METATSDEHTMRTDSPVGALRPRDAARYLGIGMETLRTSDLPRTYLPGRGVKGILVYRVVDLDAYLARHLAVEGLPGSGRKCRHTSVRYVPVLTFLLFGPIVCLLLGRPC